VVHYGLSRKKLNVFDASDSKNCERVKTVVSEDFDGTDQVNMVIIK